MRRSLARFLGVLVAVAIVVGVLYFPLSAVLWHALHGNPADLTIGRAELPLMWWRTTDTDSGQSVLLRAHAAETSRELLGKLTFRRLNPSEIGSKDELIANWQRLVDRRAAGRLNTTIPVVLQTPKNSFYCVKSAPSLTYADIQCWSPDIAWGISFFGSQKEEPEVESILLSMR